MSVRCLLGSTATPGSMLPVTTMTAAPSTSPSTMEPESPMKIRAG